MDNQPKKVLYVKDCLIRAGGLENFEVTKELIKSCRQSKQKYDEYLRLEKEKSELEEKRKRDAATVLEATTSKEKEKENLKEKLRKHKNDLLTLKDGIKSAEEVVNEGNRDLADVLKGKSMDKHKLKICQSKIDMGLKRKAELDTEVKIVEKQVETIQKKLKL